MKTISFFIRVSIFIFLLSSCSNANYFKILSEKEINLYNIRSAENEKLSLDISGLISDNEISLVVPRDMPLIGFIPYFEYKGYAVFIGSERQVSGKNSVDYQNSFINPVIAQVYSYDGSYKEYSVKVKNSDAYFTSYTVSPAEPLGMDISGNSMYFAPPQNFDLSACVPVYVFEGSKVLIAEYDDWIKNNPSFKEQTSNTNVVDFSAPKVYRIIPVLESDPPMEYLASALRLVSLEFHKSDNNSGWPADKYTAYVQDGTFNVQLPNGTDLSTIVPKYKILGTSISFNGKTAGENAEPIDARNGVSIQVKGKGNTGVIKNYSMIITLAANPPSNQIPSGPSTVAVTGLSISPLTANLARGQTLQLIPTISPANATNTGITYSSRNSSFATVSSTGLVSGIAEGTVVITATSNDGGYTAQSTISVYNPVTGISVSPTTITFERASGNTQTITATITPSDATNRAILWTTSNASVATVTPLTINTAQIQEAGSTGNAIITATTLDGSFSAQCIVTVQDTTPPPELVLISTLAGNGFVKLDWLKPSVSDYSHVRITWTSSASTGGPVTVASPAITYTVTGLTLGYQYTFTLRTVDTSSNQSSGTTASSTPVYTFNDVTTKEYPQTSGQQFTARSGHSTVVFNSKLWILGGTVNDMYSSSDGLSWSNEGLFDPDNDGRNHHTSLVVSGTNFYSGSTIISYGGLGENSDDSNKGIVWYQPFDRQSYFTWPSTGYGNVSDHTSLIFDNKQWIIAGQNESLGDGGPKNTVYSSTDAANWFQETASAQFSVRYDHSSVIFDGRMWVIGGKDENGYALSDVWSSSDGIVWDIETSSAAFGPRYAHASVVYNGLIWLIGGLGDHDARCNDVWFSVNGIQWCQASMPSIFSSFSARSDHTAVVFDPSDGLGEKIFVIGGRSDGGNLNDVWVIK